MKFSFLIPLFLFQIATVYGFSNEFSIPRVYATLDTIDYFIKNKNFEEGLKIANDIITKAESENMGQILDLSYVYDKKADCEESLGLSKELENSLRQTVKIREQHLKPDDMNLAFSYSRLFRFLGLYKYFEESIEYAKKAAFIFNLHKENEFYSGVIFHIAITYERWSNSQDHSYSFVHGKLDERSISKLKSSIRYFLLALKLKENPLFNYGRIHHSIANSFSKIKDYENAIIHYLKSLELDSDDNNGINGQALTALVRLYEYNKKPKKSLEYAFKYFDYYKTKAKSDLELAKLHNELASVIFLSMESPYAKGALLKLFFYKSNLV